MGGDPKIIWSHTLTPHTFPSFFQTKVAPKPPHKTKVERLDDVLEVMKNRNTVEEVNLAEILADKERMKEDFPEVTKLLKEVINYRINVM